MMSSSAPSSVLARFLAGAITLLTLIGPSASEAIPLQVASSEDSGQFPSVTAYVSTSRPSSLAYELTATPPASVKLHWSVTCRAGNRSVGTDSTLNPVSPPLAGGVPLTVGEPDSCDWQVNADYVDFDQVGTLAIRLLAEIRPEWVRCKGPSWSRAALLKVHDIPCGVATRLVRQAVQRRPGDGNFVRIGSFYCSRARFHDDEGARVNCYDSPGRLQFQGRLKVRSPWLSQ